MKHSYFNYYNIKIHQDLLLLVNKIFKVLCPLRTLKWHILGVMKKKFQKQD
jgi:hypothetical protein